MPLVAFPGGSPSTNRTCCSAAARLAARFTAVVVFPTPPFWFAMAMIRAKIDTAPPRVQQKKEREAEYWPPVATNASQNVPRGTIRRQNQLKRPGIYIFTAQR